MDEKGSSHHCPYCCPHCQKQYNLAPRENLIYIEKSLKAILYLEERIKKLEDEKRVKFR